MLGARAVILLGLVQGCDAHARDDADTVTIAPGVFTMGSSPHARALALDEAVAHGADARAATARLREELPVGRRKLAGYAIMVHPVTQADYAAYVYESGAAEPWVDSRTWSRTSHRKGEEPKRVGWRNGRPQAAREQQPAVLVSHAEAEAYCAHWGERRDGLGRLPTEAQWERAARGDDGRAYPWGPAFVPQRANTRESGRGDMVAVASLDGGVSPHGVYDVAGNVAEWTAAVENGEAIVKGASWSDDLVAARPAARRRAAAALRHVSIGFRCVLD